MLLRHYINGNVATLIFIKRKEPTTEYNVLVDTEDLQKILNSDINWLVSTSGNTIRIGGYPKDKSYGEEKYVLLYRLILGCYETSQVVDHINRDVLDNRKSNLRVCTHGINAQNKPDAMANSKTGVRGVYNTKNGKYSVRIKIPNGKYTCFGVYDSIEEAEKIAIKAKRNYQPYCNFNA